MGAFLNPALRNGLPGKVPDADLLEDSRESRLDKADSGPDGAESVSRSLSLRRKRLSVRRFGSKKERGMSFMDRVRTTIYSTRPSISSSRRRSTMHIKHRARRPPERRPKLSKRKDKKLCVDWAHRSLLHHVGTFITVLFVIFSAVFLFYLYGSAVAYESRLISEIGYSFEKESKFYMNSVIN